MIQPCAINFEILDQIAPQRAALRIKAAVLKGAFDGRISRVNLGADAAYAALFCILEQTANQAAANALASPLRCDEKRNDVHCFSAEFRAPFIGSVSVTAEDPFGIFGNNYKPAVGRVHNVLKHAAGIFGRSLRTNVGQKLTSQIAQLVHVLRDG